MSETPTAVARVTNGFPPNRVLGGSGTRTRGAPNRKTLVNNLRHRKLKTEDETVKAKEREEEAVRFSTSI